jgi:AcrR family transcriptional regulator
MPDTAPATPAASRPRGPEEVRAAVLAAASALFAERGPGSVTIRQIAERAGVNHALVHRYLGSKQDVLAAWVADNATAIGGAAGAGVSPRERLPEIFEAAYARRGFIRLIALAEIQGGSFADLFGDFPLVAALIAGLDAELATDPAPPGALDPRIVAGGIQAAGIGCVAIEGTLRHGVGAEAVPDEVVRAQIVRVLEGLWDAARLPAPGAAERAALRVPAPAADPAPGPERGPDAVRAAALRAAAELYAGPAPGSVTIRRIAERAGVNHALLHRYFGTKDDLLAALFAERGAAILGELRPGAPLREDLPRLLARMTRDRVFARLLVLRELGGAGLPEVRVDPVTPVLCERLMAEATGRAAGTITPQTAAAAIMALSVMWTVLDTWAIRAGRIEDATPEDLLPDAGRLLQAIHDLAVPPAA